MAPPDLTSATGTPAGYGRSCTNCSKAKCKCILRSDGVACERCHRLAKSCQPMTTSRKRVGKKSATSRTAQLEEKLDDLVSILRASQSTHQPQAPPTVPIPAPVSAPSFSDETASYPTLSRLESLATAATSTPPRVPPNPLPQPFGFPAVSLDLIDSSRSSSADETWKLPEPTPAEAETYLDKFRGWIHNFPFMVIPHEMTAAKLHEEKPFLWLCIMNITSMSVPQQQVMKERVRAEVTTRIIINHERSLDILQGLVAYIAWFVVISTV